MSGVVLLLDGMIASGIEPQRRHQREVARPQVEPGEREAPPCDRRSTGEPVASRAKHDVAAPLRASA